MIYVYPEKTTVAYYIVFFSFLYWFHGHFLDSFFKKRNESSGLVAQKIMED